MQRSLRINVILFFALLSTPLPAQTLDSNQINRLYYTAKVWGYMKYFHSEVAKGLYNWDSVLIQILPDVINASSDAQFNAAILSMIKKPGATARTFIPPPVIPESLKYNLDLAWIDDQVFSQEVLDSLTTLKTWARYRTNKYASQIIFPNGAPGNAFLGNDTGYYYLAGLPDEKVRLLGLFRYWNVINYFAPNKNIIDVDWDTVLSLLIPKFYSCATAASYHTAVFEIQHYINDSHAFTWCELPTDSIFSWYSSNPNAYYFPLFINQVEGKTVVMKVLGGVTTVKPGDIVLKINDVEIHTMRERLRPYTQGSNPAVVERNIDYRLTKGKQNESVNLEVESSDGIKQVSLTRTLSGTEWRTAVFQSTPSWQKLSVVGKTVGLVNMEKLTEAEIDPMFKDLASADGIIFDLRNYPQWTNWKFAKYLYPSSFVFAKYTYPDVRYAGTFGWRDEVIGGTPLFTPYSGKVGILFNEETQSLSEATIMAIERHKSKDSIKAIKIGSQSSGADGNISNVYLPGKIQIWFTGLGWYYPNHSVTQRIGIIPDILVKPTIEGVRQGKDDVLDGALNALFPSMGVKPVSGTAPETFSLFQNYPNPFNPTTTINYQIPMNGLVTLKVFDLLGREVATLVNEQKQPGSYEVTWNAKNISSGIYFYELRSGEFVQTKKLVLHK